MSASQSGTGTIALPADVLAAIDAYRAAQPAPRPSREEVVGRAVRAWLATQAIGPEDGLSPEELNSSNDG